MNSAKISHSTFHHFYCLSRWLPLLFILFGSIDVAFGQRPERLQQRIENTIREYAVIESVPLQEIRSPIESTILWMAEPGTEVQAGDLVARLDISALEKQLEQQQTRYQTATAETIRLKEKLATLKRGQASLSAAADKSLKAAQLALKNFAGEQGLASSELDLVRAEQEAIRKKLSLLENRQKTGDSDVSLQLIDVRLSLKAVGQKLTELKAYHHPLKTAELEAVVAAKQAEADEIRSKLREESTEIEIQSSAAGDQLQREGLKLEKLKDLISSCSLTAPKAGAVLWVDSKNSRNRIEIGSTVRERQSMIQIVDDQNFLARTLVNESRIGKVKKGQKVKVSVASLRGKTLDGVVESINRFPEPTTFLGSDVQKYGVAVKLNSTSSQLRHGMTALAEIQIKDE